MSDCPYKHGSLLANINTVMQYTVRCVHAQLKSILRALRIHGAILSEDSPLYRCFAELQEQSTYSIQQRVTADSIMIGDKGRTVKLGRIVVRSLQYHVHDATLHDLCALVLRMWHCTRAYTVHTNCTPQQRAARCAEYFAVLFHVPLLIKGTTGSYQYFKLRGAQLCSNFADILEEMLGTGHATAITTAATAATAATTATSSTTTAQQQQRKRVSMMEAAQGIIIALSQTVTVQLDAPPDAKVLLATHTHNYTVLKTVTTNVELLVFAVTHALLVCIISRWHMPFATAAVGNSPASIVSITGDSQSASTDTTTTASTTSRSSSSAAYFEKSKLTGTTMLHIKGLKEGRVELKCPCHPPRQRPGTTAGSNYTMRITVRAEVMSPMLQ
eukprot:18600-Heterococcus_DN1.PRE.1